MDRIRDIAKQAQRRMTAAAVLEAAGRGSMLGAGVGVVLVGVEALLGSPVGWPVLGGGPIVLGAIAGAALAIWRRPALLNAAVSLDAALGLKDRVSTGLALGNDADDPFAALSRQEALMAGERASVPAAVPLRAGSSWLWTAVLAGVAACGGMFLPRLDVLGGKRRAEVAAQNEQARAAVSVQIEQAVRTTNDNRPSDEASAARPDQLATLDDIRGELEAGRLSPADAAQKASNRLDELAQAADERAEQLRREQEALRERLASAGEKRPGGSPTDGRLSRAITGGDVESAQAAADDLAKLSERSSPEQREAMARELEELARALATPPKNAGQDGDPRDENAEAQRALREQGLSPDEARRIANEPERSAAQAAMERMGVPPETAKKLSDRLAEAQRERQARERAAEQASELAEAAQQAANELRQPDAAARAADAGRPGGELPKSAPQPTTPASDSASGERPATPPGAPPERPSPADPRAGELPRKSETPSPTAAERRQTDARSSSSEQPTPNGSQTPAGQSSATAKPSDSASPTPTSTPGQEQKPADVNRSDPATPREQPTSPSGDREPPTPGSPASPSASTPTGEPQAGASGATGEGPPPRPDKAAPTGEQKPAETTKQEQTPPNGGAQPSSDAQTSPDSAEPRPSGQQSAGSRPNDGSTPPQASPGGERGAQGQPTGQGMPTAAGEQGPGGDSPGARPTDQPGAGGVQRFTDQLKRLAEQRREGQQEARRAQDLREQARRMAERLTPEQRRDLEQWSRQPPASKPEQGQSSGSAGDRGGEGGGDGLGGAAGQTLGRDPAPLLPSQDDPPTFNRSDPVDARSRPEPGGSPRERVAAEWLGRGSKDGQGVSSEASEVFRAAQKSAERAVDDRAVPARFDRLLERYFRRLPERAGGAGEAGGGAGVAPAADAPRPAEDAK